MIEEELIESIDLIGSTVLLGIQTRSGLGSFFFLLFVKESQGNYFRFLAITEINLWLRDLDFGSIALSTQRGCLRTATGISTFGASTCG